MNNTTNKADKTYLVSFGNSSQYILHDSASGKESKLTRIEDELNSFLKEKFPDEAFAYFTSPHIKEIEKPEDYAGYPELDSAALDQIKKVLLTEVKNFESQQELDSDAPFANVNPGAADISHIL